VYEGVLTETVFAVKKVETIATSVAAFQNICIQIII